MTLVIFLGSDWWRVQDNEDLEKLKTNPERRKHSCWRGWHVKNYLIIKFSCCYITVLLILFTFGLRTFLTIISVDCWSLMEGKPGTHSSHSYQHYLLFLSLPCYVDSTFTIAFWWTTVIKTPCYLWTLLADTMWWWLVKDGCVK